MNRIQTLIGLLFCAVGNLHPSVGQAQNFPGQPKESGHPGSGVYQYPVKQESLRLLNRKVEMFIPVTPAPTNKIPLVVFGHGQAISVAGYDMTLKHLAAKGVAVAFPSYDTGFFDQNWRRMAKDFNSLTAEVLKKYPQLIDSHQVTYAGHSKGGYIALMAAGEPGSKISVQSLVLFSPAGYDAEYLSNLNPRIPMTLIWGETDSVISRASLEEIYSKAPSLHKQFILARSYKVRRAELSADHFFTLNKSFFFGGHDGVNALHFFGSWKWLLGAVWDVASGGMLNNPYIYGDQTNTTGWSQLRHDVLRNW